MTELKDHINSSATNFLIELVNQLRPSFFGGKNSAIKNFDGLMRELELDVELRLKVRDSIKGLFVNKTISGLLTESGVNVHKSIVKSFFQKISFSILPPIYDQDDIRGDFNLIFNKKSDYQWLLGLPIQKIISFLQLVFESDEEDKVEDTGTKLYDSIDILSHRLVGISLESELKEREKGLYKRDSPFLILHKQITDLIWDKEQTSESISNHYEKINLSINECLKVVADIRKSQHDNGASLSLTYILQKLYQHIQRLRVLLNFLTIENDHKKYRSIALFFIDLVKYEKTKYSLRNHFDENVEILAYQITEHKVKIGDHYIANNKEEYNKMLYSSMGGGLIVGILANIKVAIYNIKISLFGEAFFYSMNYSLGFVGIHLCHYTLATKQPAMTASKIATSLDVKSEEQADGIKQLSDLIVKVFRSQFISFMGNIFIAFPIAFLIAYLYHLVFGNDIAGSHKAWKLIHGLDPFSSLSIFYAGIAGVFLFASSIISGYYDNAVIFNKIPERLRKQAFINKVLPSTWVNNLCDYISSNTGSLLGNFTLGIFMGSAGTIGFIFGLPIDIQHITFAAGNFGLAMASVGASVDLQTVFLSLFGILAIGGINFIVSFGLAIFVAIKSRKIAFKKTTLLLKYLGKSFVSKPLSFFIPPKQ